MILISPYLQIAQRLREQIEDKERLKIDIRIVYGKSDLQVEETEWLQRLHGVRTSFCKNLHAKCYLNENKALITSMNLYEFSQMNNHEMGILVHLTEDEKLFLQIQDEAKRLIRNSDEVRLTVQKVAREGKGSYKPREENHNRKPWEKQREKKNRFLGGYCIRCKDEIKLAPTAPLCSSCYRTWAIFENPEFKERYCHICGSDSETTKNRPACTECYRKHRHELEWPNQWANGTW